MHTWEQRADLLREESRHFQHYLAGLPEDAWEHQSACDQWLIKDVVAHLVGNADFYATTVERGLKGQTDPLPGRPPAGMGHPSVGAADIAAGAIANRERLGGQLLAALDAQTERLLGLLLGLTPQDRHQPCYHPGGIVPAENFVDLRFKELALHQWDIRSVLEPGAEIVPGSWSSMIVLITESLASGSLRWAFWGGPVLSQPVRYRFEVPEPTSFRADIVVEGDKFRFEAPSDQPAEVELRCNGGILALIMSGRLPVAEAVSQGKVVLTGDHGLASQFSEWFKGI
ncbi:MAG: hypothetical protein ETSY1_04535 [Candidatus Entotheonella factor]|uniref:Mycothiol-dependent maleylpyruvate isomerase metal-binding domain-containing protein n=1 Tax=Entotheonella factor TaxID=1429438 RepID=W4LXQ0_ENTF1|nr:maleylpyruvate isomerase N-terminal domain-containing protein [Candidatus Entotheonella palauensis]ETX02162.1 MAG: hypothetical protein ETSY1_04535 [Candidatus Entotheonella factor]